MTARKILAAAAALAVVMGLSVANAASAATPIPVPSNLYLVNYFPSANSGPDAWIHYSHSVLVADIAKAQALGFNAFRVQVPAGHGAFDFPNPTSAQLANLTDFYNTCKAAGFKIQFSLFDLFGQKWGYIADSRTWVTAVINALKANDPTLSSVAVFETKNEALPGSENNVTYTNGYDSGWPAGVVKPKLVWDNALVWIDKMTRKIRNLAPGIPVTTSMPTGQGTVNGGLGQYVRAVEQGDPNVGGYKVAPPDFWDFHDYFDNSGSNLQTALNTVAGTGIPLRMGEIGYDLEGTSPTAAQRQTQANVTQDIRHYAGVKGVPEGAYWQLWDLRPDSSEFGSGQSDGLYSTSGTLTPVGKMYQQYPPGTAVPLP